MSSGRNDAAGGILRRVENDQLGTICDQIAKLIDVQRETAALAQRDRHRLRALETNHRFENRKAGVGENGFVAFLEQRDDGEVHHRLAARDHAHVLRPHLDAARARNVAGDGLPQFRQALRWAVFRPAFRERFLAGRDYVGRRRKVRLADFEMNDALALRFERARLYQDVERRFDPNTGHFVDQMHGYHVTPA